MQDIYKTKKQLIAELNELRGRVAEFKARDPKLDPKPGLTAAEGKLLRTIVDNLPDHIYAKDVRGRLIFSNAAHRQHLGIATPTEVLGKTASDLYQQEIATQLYAGDMAIVESGQGFANREEQVDSHKWVSTSKLPVHADNGSVIGIIGISRDITEQKQAETQLKRSEARSRAMLNAMPDLMFRLSENGIHLDFHASNRETLLVVPETFLGKRVDEVLPEDVAREYLKHIRLVLQTDDMQIFEYALEFPHGETHEYEARMVVSGENEVLVIVRDITERKRTEMALRESEKRYRIVSELVSDYAFSIQLGADGRANRNWVTDAFERITGYTPGEIGARGIQTLIHPDDLKTVQSLQAETEAGRATRGQYRIVTKSGEERWLNVLRRPEWDDEEQRVVWIYGAAQDITERKRAEEALEVRLDFQRLITTLATEFINLPVGEIDAGIESALQLIGEFVNADRSYILRFSGDLTSYVQSFEWHQVGVDPRLSARHAVGADQYPWFTNRIKRFETINIQQIADLPAEASAEKATLQAQDVKSLVVVPLTFKERLIGGLGFHATQAEVAWSDDVISLLNITGEIFVNAMMRKQADDALRESEERYRLMTDLISDYAFSNRFMPDGARQTEWDNASLTRLTGYTVEELANGVAVFHPEDAAMVEQQLEQTAAGQSTEGEYRIITKSGDVRWLYVRRHPIWSRDGIHVELYYGVAQDITERKEAEEALRESEERYRIITELISDYAFSYQVSSDGAWENEWVTGDSYTRVTGYTVGEIGYTFRLYHPDDAQIAEQHLKQTLQGKPSQGEYRIITKSGDLRWIHLRRHPVWNADGSRVERFYGVAQDITERRRTEAALHQSEQQQAALLDAMTDIAFLLDVDGTLLAANEAAGKAFGKRVHEIINAPAIDLLSGYEVAEARWLQMNKAMQSGAPVRFEDERGGRYFDNSIHPILDQAGQVTRLAIFARDITERKKSQQALLETERRFRTIFERSRMGVVIVGLDNRFIEVNEHYCEITGYSKAELMTMKFADITHPDDIEEDLRLVRQLVSGKLPYYSREKRYMHKGGAIIWIAITAAIIQDEDGSPLYGIAMIEDITERKQAEEALRYHNDFQQLIATLATEFINLPIDRIDDAIIKALRRIGEFVGVDRSYLGRYSDDYEEVAVMYEWCGPGFGDAPGPHVSSSYQAFPWLLQHLMRSEVVNVANVADLPAEASREKIALEAWGGQSLLEVPLIYDENLVGFLGYNTLQPNRTWTENTIDLLRIVGEIFINALERKRVESELRALNEQLEKRVDDRTTDLSAANALLRESEANFRQLAENIDECFWLANLEETRALYVSPAFEKIYGLPTESMYEDTRLWRQLLHPEDQGWVAAAVDHGANRTGQWDDEYRIIRPDGEVRWVRDRWFPVRNANGEVYRVAGLAVDITERKQAYEKAQELATLEERQRLARDLHDAVSQTLFSANLIAASLPSLLERNPDLVSEQLASLRLLTSGALAEMRALLMELRPSALIEASLGDLLTNLANAFVGQKEAALSLEIEGDGALPANVKIGLYRIAQEALNNITKHAHASRVDVSLHYHPQQVVLKIRDDGRGFDPSGVTGDHMGLRIMQERADTLDVELSVVSQLEQGSEISALWTARHEGEGYE